LRGQRRLDHHRTIEPVFPFNPPEEKIPAGTYGAAEGITNGKETYLPKINQLDSRN
jgi:hypothetical protein